jgi:hypothetical protein
MALPATTPEIWQELRSRVSEEELVSAVYHQLKSDIERSGLTIPFTNTVSPDLWNHELAVWLPSLSSTALHSYLYLVDLPEKWLNMLQISDHFFEELAAAILYREMVKVYYKMNYSN